MYSILCHKDVFMPKCVKAQANNLQKNLKGFYYSEHMKKHLYDREDNKHDYLQTIVEECIGTLNTQPREVFEVELSKSYKFFKRSGWFITKYCCRIPYNDDNDLVVVIRPKYNRYTGQVECNKNMITTAWLNNKNDGHYTLDVDNYCSLEEWNRNNIR